MKYLVVCLVHVYYFIVISCNQCLPVHALTCVFTCVVRTH